jgi:stage V sporulation protein SpoVS
MDSNFFFVFISLAFVAVIIYLAYNMIKYKGIRGALYGSLIKNEIGEAQGIKRSIVNQTIKVNSLSDSGVNNVGIEICAKSVLSYQVMAINLEKSEAEKLVTYLQEAIKKA